MVLSPLPLKICFPSGLHAIEKTLKLQEVSTRINTNREEKIEQNLHVRVPGQRRLAISRLRVPNLDGIVHTAAGNFFSIGAPRHREDPDVVRSQDTNQQKLRGKHLGKKNLEKKTYGSECPVRVESQWPVEMSQILTVLSLLPLATSLPSGEKATELTLRLDKSAHEWISQHMKHTSKEEKHGKKTYPFEWPVSVDLHSKVPVEPTDQIFTV